MVDTLCKVIPYVENKLLLCEAFDYGNGMEQPSCEDQNKLSEARTKCGNSVSACGCFMTVFFGG